MRPQRADFKRLNRVGEIIDRAGRTGEMQDIVHRPIHGQVLRHVMFDQWNFGLPARWRDVFGSARDEVIDGDDFMAFGQKSLAQVGADKAATARDQRSHAAALRMSVG